MSRLGAESLPALDKISAAFDSLPLSSTNHYMWRTSISLHMYCEIVKPLPITIFSHDRSLETVPFIR